MCHWSLRSRGESGWAWKIPKENGWKCLKFCRRHSLQIQEAKQIPNKINPRHLIIKLLKTKAKKILERIQKKTHLTNSGKESKWSQISHQKPEEPEQRAQNDSRTERKQLSNGILYPVKRSWGMEGKPKTLRWRKTKTSCHQQPCPERMAKWISLNRKELIKQEVLEHQKERKNNRKRKIMGEYDRFFLSSWIFNVW